MSTRLIEDCYYQEEQDDLYSGPFIYLYRALEKYLLDTLNEISIIKRMSVATKL